MVNMCGMESAQRTKVADKSTALYFDRSTAADLLCQAADLSH